MATLEMTINGKVVVLELDGMRPLVDILRDDLGLTGTKIGCREGECGACTVLLDGQAVNSCLLPAMKAHGRSVITIEGIGTVESPHLVQIALAEAGGVQCGYCTPGFVLATKSLLNDNPNPSEDEIREAMVGHLCRCTGYVQIIEAIQDAVSQLRHEGGS